MKLCDVLSVLRHFPDGWPIRYAEAHLDMVRVTYELTPRGGVERSYCHAITMNEARYIDEEEHRPFILELLNRADREMKEDGAKS